jgi:glutaredoxin 3
MTQIIDIYTKFGCPYCARAKQLLIGKGAIFNEIDVTMGGAPRAEMESRAPSARTVPQIFIGDKYIGGCDDLYALDKVGNLNQLLQPEAPAK